MDKVILYTDGACSGNPGIGGWGCVLKSDKYSLKKEFSGVAVDTTNNKMELTAVIEGLKKLKMSCYVEIYSDSAYVVNAFELGWVKNWIANSWKTADKKEVKNVELWQELLELCSKHKVSWFKVKGHADNEYNNRCDYLATHAISQYKKDSNISD